LRAERAVSGSIDLGGVIHGVELNATLFASTINHPVAVRRESVVLPAELSRLFLENAPSPTRTNGTEVLARWRPEPFSITATYTFVRSTELEVASGKRKRSPLVPSHQIGLVTMFEEEGLTRVGLEIYYTGRQALEDNPFRSVSRPYTHIGVLAERRIGRARFFINAENLLDVRQTKYDPLVRPTAGPGGRWTTDVWAPLDGRVANVGVRLDLAGRPLPALPRANAILAPSMERSM
jgi:iron complex outermembrane receptor protein